MARPKKTTGTKKSVAKKTTAKKATAKKKPSSAKVSTKIKGLEVSQRLLAAKPSTRRPPNNPDMPQLTIEHLNAMLNDMKGILDNYSQHLRALDRRRLNGVGIRKLGFIERSRVLFFTDDGIKAASFVA